MPHSADITCLAIALQAITLAVRKHPNAFDLRIAIDVEIHRLRRLFPAGLLNHYCMTLAGLDSVHPSHSTLDADLIAEFNKLHQTLPAAEDAQQRIDDLSARCALLERRLAAHEPPPTPDDAEPPPLDPRAHEHSPSPINKDT